MCVLIFYANFVWNIFHYEKNWAIYIGLHVKYRLFYIYIGLHVKYPLFLPDLKETWIVSTIFGKYQIS